MAFGDFKDLTRKTASYKILCDKEFNMANNPKYDEYQHGLVSMVYKFFDKKLQLKKLKINQNELQTKNQLKNYRKQLLKKFKKRKVHSSFIDNSWGADLTDMQLISKFNKEIYFLSCAFDIFTKYA